MRHIQYLHLIPVRFSDCLSMRRSVGLKRWAAGEDTPAPSLRILPWLVVGLTFLGLFLMFFWAKGWM
jgi:hypothetical protein